MNMNGWHVKELFTLENTLSIYLSIVLKTVLGDSSFKIIFKIFNILLIWDKNVELHTSWPVAKLLQIRPWVYFLLTLNMGMADGILYCLNLNLSMHLRVGSRGLVTFKIKLYVTTFNNSFLLLPVFCQKELHRRCCIRLELNIVTQSTKILKSVRGHSLRSSATLGKYLKNTPSKMPWKYISRDSSHYIKCLYLISNGLNGVNINLLT